MLRGLPELLVLYHKFLLVALLGFRDLLVINHGKIRLSKSDVITKWNSALLGLF